MERASIASPQNPKTRNRPSFDLCLGHFPSPVSFAPKISFDLRFAYPAGKGSEAIRRTIVPNSRRVRWLSARSSQL